MLEKYLPDLFEFVKNGEVSEEQLSVFLKDFNLDTMLVLNKVSKSLYDKYQNQSPYSYEGQYIDKAYTEIFSYGNGVDGTIIYVAICDITREDLLAKVLKANCPNEEV